MDVERAGQSTQSASSLTQQATDLLDLFSIVVAGLTGEVGFTCNPITGVGIGGNSWYA